MYAEIWIYSLRNAPMGAEMKSMRFSVHHKGNQLANYWTCSSAREDVDSVMSRYSNNWDMIIKEIFDLGTLKCLNFTHKKLYESWNNFSLHLYIYIYFLH